MSDYVAQAKEDRDNLNKQRRHRYQYRKRLSNNITSFTKHRIKTLKAKKGKILPRKNDLFLKKQCFLCSTATSIVSARSRPVNSSQQTNIIDLFDPNLEFSQEQVIEEYIDDFLSEQDSPLSQNNDDDSDSISTNDDNIDTILIDQVDSELHSFTPISVKSAMLEFLQLIRQSQINKKQSEHFLSFIKSILPCPNQMPKNMNSLLKRLDVTDYFKKRTICILCEKELEKKQNLYIHGLLANIVSRLALDIEEYKKLIFNPNQETKFDIPFAKVYQRLIQQHSTENLLTLLLHVDGIGLVKSSKLKLWICDASIIELPPELRYRRANVFLISVYIGYTEPNVNIWLKSSFHTLIELKKTG
ncbi:unnamed protein product [Rotaria socialis]|uniref:Uncharacterized protein n=1 Tax=Rotaria socialis TaxID=392032 RepID=A0A818JM64_9BILA|nr:unnamed protein product [Rotaria socialis]CAF4832277.1 unnamed protein product [Rotaria socialis]